MTSGVTKLVFSGVETTFEIRGDVVVVDGGVSLANNGSTNTISIRGLGKRVISECLTTPDETGFPAVTNIVSVLENGKVTKTELQINSISTVTILEVDGACLVNVNPNILLSFNNLSVTCSNNGVWNDLRELCGAEKLSVYTRDGSVFSAPNLCIPVMFARAHDQSRIIIKRIKKEGSLSAGMNSFIMAGSGVATKLKTATSQHGIIHIKKRKSSKK